MAKCRCSINDSIMSEYPFIKAVDENVECTLCNANAPIESVFSIRNALWSVVKKKADLK
jgi:hypothetical protein